MTGGGRGYCAIGWDSATRRGFGLQSAPRRGYYGGGRFYGGGRWSGVPAADDAPIEAFDGLAGQIERLTERVEALSARLDARDRGDE